MWLTHNIIINGFKWFNRISSVLKPLTSLKEFSAAFSLLSEMSNMKFKI